MNKRGSPDGGQNAWSPGLTGADQTCLSAIPAGPGEITARWLTEVLRAGGHLPRGAVAAVSVETIGADRGFTGVIARLRLRYEGAADPPPPASLVAKLPTAVRDAPSAYRLASGRDAAAARAYYERCAREVSFYRDLSTGADAVPRLYHAAVDPDRQRVVLLLADLTGGRPGDALTGCSPAQAGAIIDAIAPLHARMWRESPPGWWPAFVTDPAANQQRYASRVGPFLERYGHRLPPAVGVLVERLRSEYAAVLAELMEAPTTVVHSDLHLDNVIFDAAYEPTPDRSDPPPGTGHPVTLLDWQSACRGPAAVDVADVLGSLPMADRRASAPDLLERHAARIAESGVDDYPVERLWRDCRLALLNRLAGRVGWLATADPDALSGRERALIAAALDDIVSVVEWLPDA